MPRKTVLCRKCRKRLADQRRAYFREYQRKRRAFRVVPGSSEATLFVNGVRVGTTSTRSGHVTLSVQPVEEAIAIRKSRAKRARKAT